MQAAPETGTVRLTARQLASALIVLIGGLILIQSCLLILVHIFGKPTVFGLVDAFDFGGEGNITALVSTLMMLASAAVLAITGNLAGNTRDRLAWFLLAGVFIFLAVDEATMIHEFASAPTREALSASWVPQLAWVLPYGAAMLVLAAILLPWFLRLDRSSQIRFVIAGFLFVSGAIGFELFESAQMREILAANPDTVVEELQDPVIDCLILCEESLEMIGVALFLQTLIHRLGGFTLRTGA